MTKKVCMGAMLKCDKGAAPASLIVLPINRVFTENLPAATKMDFAPMVNIPTFVMCNSKMNPAVIAAMAASSGSVTQAPCVPVTTPWSKTFDSVKIGGQSILTKDSTCQCAFGGKITITNPGQNSVDAG